MSTYSQPISQPQQARGIAVRLNQIELYPLLLRLVIIGIVFAANIDVPVVDRSVDPTRTSPQAIVKLLILLFGGCLGLWGWWRSAVTRRLFISVQGGLLVALFLLHFPSCIGALAPKIAFSSGVAFGCMLFLSVAAMSHLGPRRVMFDILTGALLYLVCSWALYFLHPEMAMFTEVLSPTLTVRRLGGLGHPNVLGRTAIFVILFMYAACQGGLFKWKWFFLALPLLLVTAVVALSRTPLIAALVALGVISIPLLRNPRFVCSFGLIVGAVCLSLILMEATVGTDRLLGKFVSVTTKTGDVSELTSGTGRTRIWAEAFRIAKERPLLGHGAGASPIVMIGFSGHAHNVFLDVAITLGFPAALLALALMIWNLWDGIQSRVPLVIAITVFIFVVSLAERPLFSPIPDSMTLIWMLTMLWPVYLRVVPDDLAKSADVSLRTH